MDLKIARRSEFCVELAEWLAEHFHPEWILANSLKRGIGIHHGRIPRSVAHMMISLFNKGEIGAIVCTSSMIEGINTAAENIFIYDRNISTTKLDRFTFDNIKGRAGRMFKHNVGKVFLYNAPPDQTQFDVRVPLFNADELMQPELLMQIQDTALTPNARRRKRLISESSQLPTELLGRWAEFGIDSLNNFVDIIREEISVPDTQVIWSGIPTFDQIEATFSIVWNVFNFPKHDIRTPRQLALFARRLKVSSTTREYLEGLVSETGLAAQKEIDLCFNFMRGAEYTFPQVLRAMNDVVDFVVGENIVNYRVYATQLQNHFMKGELRALDEFGVPIPLIQKLAGALPADDIDAARGLLQRPNSAIASSLTELELRLLREGLS